MQLVIATGNKGKLKEIAHRFADSGVTCVGLNAFPGAPGVEEDGTTFEENAAKKALTIARFTGQPTLADDSGLCVDALDGAPGIYSARFAGADADDVANNRKLLESLKGLPPQKRGAAFFCAMVLAWPDGTTRTFTGTIRGEILEELKGDDGFGYDPLFFVPAEGKTFAQLPLDRKNEISHRGNALSLVDAYLKNSGLSRPSA